MFALLLIIILCSTTNVIQCDVHYVTPDDDCCSDNSSCDQCYNLQHYLLNVSKYFTAHTTLYFLPGLHYLHTDLVIQNVTNISLIGITVNDGHTTIQCTGVYHIILSNINKLTIRNLVVNKCGYNTPPDVIVVGPPGNSLSVVLTVQLYYCSYVTIINMEIINMMLYSMLILWVIQCFVIFQVLE